jgi:hypothetical protein
MGRIQKDTLIDYRSISIEAKGRVNGNKKNLMQVPRGDHANLEDGFVYTSSTKKSLDGEKFYYRYEGLDMGEKITKTELYNDSDADAMFQSIEYYRNEPKYEGIISYHDKQGVMDGTSTPTKDFIFNEGNAYLINKELSKHSVDGQDTLATLNDKTGDGYFDGTLSFYDRHADVWSKELTKIRGMVKD